MVRGRTFLPDRKSLTFRLIVGASLLCGATLLAAFVLITTLFDLHLRRGVDADLIDRLDDLAAGLEIDGRWRDRAGAPARRAEIRTAALRPVLADRGGWPAADALPLPVGRAPAGGGGRGRARKDQPARNRGPPIRTAAPGPAHLAVPGAGRAGDVFGCRRLGSGIGGRAAILADPGDRLDRPWRLAWSRRWCCRCGSDCGRSTGSSRRWPRSAPAPCKRLSDDAPTEIAPLAQELNALARPSWQPDRSRPRPCRRPRPCAEDAARGPAQRDGERGRARPQAGAGADRRDDRRGAASSGARPGGGRRAPARRAGRCGACDRGAGPHPAAHERSRHRGRGCARGQAAVVRGRGAGSERAAGQPARQCLQVGRRQGADRRRARQRPAQDRDRRRRPGHRGRPAREGVAARRAARRTQARQRPWPHHRARSRDALWRRLRSASPRSAGSRWSSICRRRIRHSSA